MASTKLGVPVASLTRQQGRRLGRQRQAVTYGALIGGKNFNFTFPAAQTSATPGQGIAKAVSRLQARRDDASPHRHPRQGERAVHLRAERAHSRHVARPLGHPARHRRQHVAEPLPDQRRRELDQEHPGRSGRSHRQLPRGRGAEGVRGHPGRGAAQGRVEERSEVRLGQLGQLLVVGAQDGRHEHDQPGPLHHRRARPITASLAKADEDGVGDLQVPLQQLRADRPARRDRRHRRRNGRSVLYVQGQSVPSGTNIRRRHARRGLQAREHPGRSSTKARAPTAAACRGRQPSRPRSSRRRSAIRCASSGCAGTSTASTATARPRCTTSRSASTRPARSSACRLDELRPGR